MKSEVQAKMQKCLEKLGIPLNVAWTPKPDRDKHGLIELSSRTLFILDEAEEEAWQTFIHEALEWKLNQVTKVYRTIINGLIEALEKVAYNNKEEFLETVPELVTVIQEEKSIDQK